MPPADADPGRPGPGSAGPGRPEPGRPDPGPPGSSARRLVLGFLAPVLGALALGAGVLASAGPLLHVDDAVAGDLNAVVAPRPWLVDALQVVTAVGDPRTAWTVLTVLVLVLLVRGHPQPAARAAVTGLGGAVLSPLVKELVGRLRPAVATPVADASGPSFPSGHTLGATIWIGVVLLVVLPALPPAHRRTVAAVGGLLVLAVGLTRVALGVHFASDVLGGWLIGAAWLAVATAAFRPGRPEPAAGAASGGTAVRTAAPPHPLTVAARVVVAAVLLAGPVVAVQRVTALLG